MIKNKQNTTPVIQIQQKTFDCLDNSNHKVRKGVRLPSLFKSEIQNVRMEFYENKAKSQSESGQMTKMSRTAIVNFEMFYKVEFTCAIRGHHVYKTSWTPVLNEKLEFKKDNREEALTSIQLVFLKEMKPSLVTYQLKFRAFSIILCKTMEKTLFQQRLLDQKKERSDSLFRQNFQPMQLIGEWQIFSQKRY